MTINFKLDRNTIALAVGAVTLVTVFIMLMWFPLQFLGFIASALWILMIFGASALIATGVMLGVYNLLGNFFRNDEEDTEDDDEEETPSEL